MQLAESRRKPASRRSGTLAFSEAWNAPAAFGPEHLLGVVFGVLGLDARRQRKALDDQLYLGAIQHFALEQRFGNAHQRFGFLLDHFERAVVSVLHQLFHLIIDLDGGVFAVIAMLRDLAAQED